jgi:hypothetical protein
LAGRAQGDEAAGGTPAGGLAGEARGQAGVRSVGSPAGEVRSAAAAPAGAGKINFIRLCATGVSNIKQYERVVI